MAEVLYPVSEVAALWRCSRGHVYGLIATGQLRVVNLTAGRAKTRIPESSLAEYVECNSRRAGRSVATGRKAPWWSTNRD